MAQDQADPSTTETDGGDPEIYERWTRYGNGQKNWIFVPLMTPLANQLRSLPSLLPMTLTYSKGPPEWRYICPRNAPETYNMKLHDIILYVKRLKIFSLRLARLESQLAGSAAARYFIKNEFCRSFPIPQNTSTIRLPDCLMTNYLPSYMILGFLEQGDLRGNRAASNFSFQNFNITQLYARSVS